MRTHLLREAGKWIAQYVPWAEPFLSRAYGALPQSLHDHPANFLNRYFANWKRVNFIGIGACDGIAGDPIHSNVVRNLGWTGVLIEPNPIQFEQLKTNYRGREGLTFKCAAVSETPAALPFYVFNAERYGRPFPPWWSEISSLHKYHLERELPIDVHSYIDSIQVPILTLRQIVDEINCNVDLIVMDVEGHETLILRDLLRSGIRPNVIVFEHKHMPSPILREIKNEFSAQGYLWKSYGRDTIFYLLSRMQ